MADTFGCRSLHVLAPPTARTADRAGHADPAGEHARSLAQGFGDLCDRAADHGLAVALELMPTTAVATALEAQRVVEASARDNGGICVDAWHHHRGADDPDMIRSLPAELIIDVQVSDGTLVPEAADYGEDTRRNRLPPGEGEMDLRGFVEAIRSTGTTAPSSLEVCNAAAWTTDGTEFVTRCATGLRRVLEESP